MMSALTSWLNVETVKAEIAGALTSGTIGLWSTYLFIRTPQYQQIPDPRLVPVNGLHWLVVGFGLICISVWFAHRAIRRPRGPVEILRQRYIEGDLSEAEFEQALNRLFETETGPRTGTKRNKQENAKPGQSAAKSGSVSGMSEQETRR